MFRGIKDNFSDWKNWCIWDWIANIITVILLAGSLVMVIWGLVILFQSYGTYSYITPDRVVSLETGKWLGPLMLVLGIVAMVVPVVLAKFLKIIIKTTIGFIVLFFKILIRFIVLIFKKPIELIKERKSKNKE